MQKKIFTTFGIVLLLILASIGWMIFLTQKPDILAKARIKYLQAANAHTSLKHGPCLGIISDDWVLDISHIPKEPVDDLVENQCKEYLSRDVHHFVEMSPKGEIILVK